MSPSTPHFSPTSFYLSYLSLMTSSNSCLKRMHLGALGGQSSALKDGGGGDIKKHSKKLEERDRLEPFLPQPEAMSSPNQRHKWITEHTHANRARCTKEVAREFAHEQEFGEEMTASVCGMCCSGGGVIFIVCLWCDEVKHGSDGE